MDSQMSETDIISIMAAILLTSKEFNTICSNVSYAVSTAKQIRAKARESK